MPSLPIYYRVYNDSTVKLSESYAAITFSGVNKTSRVYLSSWSGTVTIPALDFSYWSPSFGSMTITFTIYVANTDYTFDPTVEITAASPSITCQLSTIAFQV